MFQEIFVANSFENRNFDIFQSVLGPGKIPDSFAALIETEAWTPKLGLFSYCGRVEQAFDIKQR